MYLCFFNTAGPVRPELHYCLDPLHRLDLAELMRLIWQQKYFVLHAPRPVGKTSFLLALAKYLNESGQYNCLYVNVEPAQTARENVGEGMRAILAELVSWAETLLQDSVMRQHWLEIWKQQGPHAALREILTQYSRRYERPFVLLIDEIDSLVGDTLISVLRQLRAGYTQRPHAFPQSVILCGVRDVRDYRLYSSEGREMIRQLPKGWRKRPLTWIK